MKHKGSNTNAIVETRDIFPTFCDLTGIEIPNYTYGVSLKEILANPNTSGHTAIAYKSNASTIRTSRHRLALHQDGFVELYDHTTAEKETKNVAEEYPDLVEELTNVLNSKLH